MKAVLSLVIVSFTGTAWQRWMTAVGLTIIILGLLNVGRVANSFPLQGLYFMGAGVFFAGSALMPKLFGQLARSHAIYSLPFGRWKLLLSALLTTALVSLPLPIMSVLVSRSSFAHALRDPDLTILQLLQLFVRLPFLWNLLANVFLFCSFMYVALWFLTASRTVFGKTLTMLITVVLLAVPPRFVSLSPDASIAPVVVAIAAFWALFAAGFLYLPRWRQRYRKQFAPMLQNALSPRIVKSNESSRAMALMLGVANPWILAGANLLCIGLCSFFLPPAGPWLFFLAILVIAASAISGLTVARSRTLWLRRPWSRVEAFHCIEVFLWRQSVLSVGVVIAWFVGVGRYAEIDIVTLALGVALIPLSAAASLYLSLMQTTGLRWADGVLAAATTLLIMAIALLAVDATIAVGNVFALEALLATSVPVFRSIARRRWSQLDWALCRAPPRMASG